MSYEPDTNTITTSNQAKLNAMGKEISIMTEIMAEFADLYLKDTGVLIGTNSKVYQEVKEKSKQIGVIPICFLFRSPIQYARMY